MGFFDDVGKGITSSVGWLTGTGDSDPGNADRNSLRGNAGQANTFGNQNAAAYGQMAGGIGANQGAQNANIAALQGLASGQNSVSAEQLRQALQQNQAAQVSQAAAASPQNAAMAARNAAMQTARLGYGMAGQQATAGLQERNQAQMALANALNNQQQGLLSQRGQDLQGALGGYGAANQGYGVALASPQKPVGPAVAGGLMGAAQLYAMSDERIKTDIKDGTDDAQDALSKLRAFKFRYRDEANGKGDQLGIMAQGLERAGLGHAVVDTPAGKAVHGAKLATALAAMLPGINARISKLEGGEK